MTNEQAITVATRLKLLRNERGLSYEKLYGELTKHGIKISVQSLKDYEITAIDHSKFGSIKGMRLETLSDLAEFYGVSFDYLLGRSAVASPDIGIQAASMRFGISEEALLNYEKWAEPIHPRYEGTQRLAVINILSSNIYGQSALDLLATYFFADVDNGSDDIVIPIIIPCYSTNEIAGTYKMRISKYELARAVLNLAIDSLISLNMDLQSKEGDTNGQH